MKKILTMVAALGTLGALSAAANSAAAADVQGNAAAAENKVAMCIGCHAIPDYKTSFPEVYRVPYLGGQNAKYIESALHAYQKGDRKHPTMRAIAGSLTDQDIANLAAYYAAQTPATQNNPQK
ncbi:MULTISPECIES: cytochrome c [Ralstonia]|jgi:cytochrome c553|uniref:Cytochrome c n=3 Tax=Ralstonia TaxID=48736 RepID=A0AAE3LBJ7_9RALS|nr:MULTISPECIES: cytochrome c [Ralstonia]MCL6469626.1 cytochrome c [Ralstonia sp.]MBB0025045.1 cytochrome c [Ralstonia pickettii]MBB0034812.1 cytochrome c [Ralstonia pickettii]MBB0098368.1 cytochrome c [Ralstonia pickettii]MBB0108164.1 cytochrome c [Ralstonia pickettii]